MKAEGEVRAQVELAYVPCIRQVEHTHAARARRLRIPGLKEGRGAEHDLLADLLVDGSLRAEQGGLRHGCNDEEDYARVQACIPLACSHVQSHTAAYSRVQSCTYTHT